MILTASNNFPVKDVRELISYAKANPDKANYGSPAAGSMPHFLGEMLAANAKLSLL